MPRVTIPSANTAVLDLPTVCDAGLVKSDARGYANKANDALVSIAGDLVALTKNGPSAASTAKAFDGLSRMAAIRGTTAMNPAVTGAVFDRLVRGFLKCMLPVVTAGALEPTPPAATGTGFQPALKNDWVFEVRGKTSAPADPAGGAYERRASGDTWWAAWPKTGTWSDAIVSTLNDGATPTPNALPDRVFIYGYRTSAAITGQLGSSFEHFSIPKINQTSFKMTTTLGLCFQNASQVTGSPRVNHANKFLNLALPITSPICDDLAAYTPTTGTVAFGPMNPIMLAKRVASFFSPQSLYAATAFFGGGSVTGSPDDWSPSAVWDLSKFTLSELGTITDGKTSAQIHLAGNAPVTLKVKVTGGGNAPDGTPVVVSVVGNNSVISFFSDSGGTPGPTATRYVKDGVVSFVDVNLVKAGGYQIAFQVAFDGIGGPLTVSNSFNIQNK